MADKYFNEVKALLEKNGEMGVNALSKAIDIPLSTMQVYLMKQSYFVKTESRKWDLPERVTATETKKTIDNFETVITNQLNAINSMFEVLTSNIRTTITLLNTHKPITAPVASNPMEIHPRLLKIQELTLAMSKAIKEHKKNIPEEYLELLQNVDWTALCIEKGAKYYQNTMGSELIDIISGTNDKISDSVLEVLEEYQKGA